MERIVKDVKKICDDCARKFGMHLPFNHVASYWEDECDVCKKKKEVTDPMDLKYMTEDF